MKYLLQRIVVVVVAAAAAALVVVLEVFVWAWVIHLRLLL